MGAIHVGTSGFASPTTRGRIGAGSGAAADLLAEYSQRFGAVELDSVFYRPPSPETVRVWIESTHDDFKVSVRMPREVTHVDRLGIPARAARFAESLRVLGDRLGCLLFTTPPSFDCDVQRFAAVLDGLPDGITTAWEFRHPSWLCCPEVMDLLVERGSAPVVVENLEGVTPGELLPGGSLWTKWGFPFVYVRFRKDRYRPGDLLAWGEILGRALGDGRGVYAFFRQAPEATMYAAALAELLVEGRRLEPSSNRAFAQASTASVPVNAAANSSRISR